MRKDTWHQPTAFTFTHTHMETCMSKTSKAEKNGARCSKGLRVKGYVAPLDKMLLVLGKTKAASHQKMPVIK